MMVWVNRIAAWIATTVLVVLVLGSCTWLGLETYCIDVPMVVTTSPDGRFDAWLDERDCGAMSRTHTVLRLVDRESGPPFLSRASDELADYTGYPNMGVVDWAGEREVTIGCTNCRNLRVFATPWHGVTVVQVP